MLLVLTVPQAAERVDRNPETIRRWIRSGKLVSTKVGTQHLVDEDDLDSVARTGSATLPLPAQISTTASGAPMPDIVGALREGRRGR